ncbi:MAG: hypothetical protein R3B99_22155 [Polyangiales bacterium]
MRRLRLVALVVALGSPVLAQPSYAPQGWASPPNPYASAPTYAAPAPAAPPVAPAEVNDPVAEAESEKVRLEAEVAALAEQRAHTEESLRARARALYRLRRSGMLPVAGGFEALLGHLSRVERLERMVSRDVRSSRFLRQREVASRRALARGRPPRGGASRGRGRSVRVRRAGRGDGGVPERLRSANAPGAPRRAAPADATRHLPRSRQRADQRLRCIAWPSAAAGAWRRRDA